MKTFHKFTPVDYHVAKKLKIFRTSIGMSQKKLGELSGVSFQQVQKYENVHNKISAARLFEFSQILNKPVSAFFEDLNSGGKYYSYKVKSDKKLKQINADFNKDILPLVRAFNMIEDKAVKKSLVNLAQEIAGPFYEKTKKHRYS